MTGRLLSGAVILAIIAGGLGFGLARWTSKSVPASPDAVAEAPASTVKVKAADLTTMGIAVQAVSPGNLAAEIETPATVVASPKGEAMVTAHAAGSVVRIDKRLGDTVRADETLALVESREAAQFAADRSVALARVAQARQAAAREQELFDEKVSPRQDLETAKANLAAAEAEARRAQSAASAAKLANDGRSVMVVSPISGRVTATAAMLGGYVQPEAELFRIADPTRVQLQAPVTGGDAARIRPGDLAQATLPSGQVVQAVVRSITPTLDPDTRSATVVLDLAAGSPPLTPGAALKAVIQPRSAATDGGFVLPDEAIQNVDGRDSVCVRTATGFRVQPVIVASRSGGHASVASGLKPGDQVATHNAFFLKAEIGKGQDQDE
jgi:cobalt-zinc-cadmium efflux system membrane fusion protein